MVNVLPPMALAAMSNSHHKANPTDAGWTYQGSNAQSRVNFYEKDGCKMDYYPTTGTVKTSMDHPTQGNTQMFRRGLDDAGYQQREISPPNHVSTIMEYNKQQGMRCRY